MWKTRRRTGWIDWRVPFGKEYRLRLIERPGLTLDDAELGRLVADLQSVSDRCVPGGPLRYGVLSGDRERLADAILAVAYRRDGGDVVGFSAMVGLEILLEDRPTRVVHAGLVIVDPSLRSRGRTAWSPSSLSLRQIRANPRNRSRPSRAAAKSRA